MTALDDILEVQAIADRVAASVEELLATIEAEERDGCEFESLCQQALAEKRKPGARPPAHPHRCGWIGAGTTFACPKRRKYSLPKTEVEHAQNRG